jgi:hypothetical protein
MNRFGAACLHGPGFLQIGDGADFYDSTVLTSLSICFRSSALPRILSYSREINVPTFAIPGENETLPLWEKNLRPHFSAPADVNAARRLAVDLQTQNDIPVRCGNARRES